MKNIKTQLSTVLLFLIISLTSFAQNVTIPMVSQKAEITQRLGISDVTISYHSPSVQGRQIFGGIVPYGSIWRAGANENTTIHFTHDATVEGQKIAHGTYGFYIIPKDDSAILLFSKYYKSWGTVLPKEEDLDLKVTVKLKEIPFQEWLSYDFIDRGSSSITATLQWEKTQIPFSISFDIKNIVVNNLRQELKGTVGFGWRGNMGAANYCLQNDINLEEAMTWIDRSISINKGFSNLQVKAGLLTKAGKTGEAEQLMDEAISYANPNQMNRYGYQLLGSGQTNKAIEVFKKNMDKNMDHPFIWGFMDSLGEAYLKDGNIKMALKYYQLAKTKAPENQQSYLDNIISNIK